MPLARRLVPVFVLAFGTGCGHNVFPIPAPPVMSSDKPPADPAVDFANRASGNDNIYREAYFDIDGLTLHYVEAGEGELIVFYHGFPSYWYSFFDQMEALRSRYRVVAVDGPGAGLSDKPPELEHYKVQALAAQLDALARHLAGDEPFTLVGHDWGGALSLTYAEAYPNRLNAVVGMSAPSYNVFLDLIRDSREQRVVSTYMQEIRRRPYQEVVENPPGESLWELGYGGLLQRGDLTEEEGELFRQALAPAEASNGGFNWYRANLKAYDAISDEDYWPSPPGEISVPVLLIIGEEDKTFVLEYVDRIRAIADDVSVVTLTGVGHWTPIQDAEKSVAAIVDFIDAR